MEDTSRKRLRKAFDACTLCSFLGIFTSFFVQCNQIFLKAYILIYK